MTEVTLTARAPATHILTIMVDLSKPPFADRSVAARFALAHVIAGLTEGVVGGAVAGLARDGDGNELGLYLFDEDKDGAGKAAFNAAAEIVRKLQENPEYETTKG